MRAKDQRVDIGRILCCALPYGTGNDLSRVTNWGGEPDQPFYATMKSLITEICWNSVERRINVWSVLVTFKEGGGTYEVSPETKDYELKNGVFFERYMINYWGIGEDARVGVGKFRNVMLLGFEKKRTNKRCCNKVVYCCIGFTNMLCKCKRPPSVFSRIEYLKTNKYKDFLSKKKLSVIKEMEFEETKQASSIFDMSPLLDNSENLQKNDGILFSTDKKDKKHFRIKGNPLCLVGSNIPSMMGGRANLWK